MSIRVLAPIVSIALAVAITPNSARSLTCAKVSEVIERADLVFTAVPYQINRESPGIEVPSIAINRVDVTATATANLPIDHVFSIQACTPSCRTWTGTVAELPATIVDPWYEIKLRIQDVWRGSPSRELSVYSTYELRSGDQYLFALRIEEGEPLMFGGPCSWGVSVFDGARLEELRPILGEPLYETN